MSAFEALPERPPPSIGGLHHDESGRLEIPDEARGDDIPT
jgi:hypothetical protein